MNVELVNTGSDSAYENIVRNALRMRGVNRLDGLILTHGNAGHVGAAVTVLDPAPRGGPG